MLADPQKFTSRKRCHRADFRDSLNSVHYERECILGYNDASKKSSVSANKPVEQISTIR